uniref:Turmerin (Fragments) n=1 Tax=Curcuma longa TaxID=136217 RepID=TURM_CURLO|nr:RecName: Full=Turmerin [Curcuma longa]
LCPLDVLQLSSELLDIDGNEVEASRILSDITAFGGIRCPLTVVQSRGIGTIISSPYRFIAEGHPLSLKDMDGWFRVSDDEFNNYK